MEPHRRSSSCEFLAECTLSKIEYLNQARIIFRAFQGIGGAGTYSMAFVIFFELVPPEKFASYTSMVSVVFAVAILLGPLLGGAVNKYTTWRWIFLLK